VELLTLVTDNDDYKIINVTDIDNYINIETSQCEFLEYPTRIMDCEKISFFYEKVVERHIFKTHELARCTVFVSDTFKKRVEEHHLKGFKFVEVWDSEYPE
jgi:hypothetical protein